MVKGICAKASSLILFDDYDKAQPDAARFRLERGAVASPKILASRPNHAISALARQLATKPIGFADTNGHVPAKSLMPQ
jgi:hypothetical protein